MNYLATTLLCLMFFLSCLTAVADEGDSSSFASDEIESSIERILTDVPNCSDLPDPKAAGCYECITLAGEPSWHQCAVSTTMCKHYSWCKKIVR